MQKNYYLNIFHYQNYITKQYRKINSADPLSQAKYYLQAAQANIGKPIKFNNYFAYSVICQAKFSNTSQGTVNLFFLKSS